MPADRPGRGLRHPGVPGRGSVRRPAREDVRRGQPDHPAVRRPPAVHRVRGREPARVHGQAGRPDVPPAPPLAGRPRPDVPRPGRRHPARRAHGRGRDRTAHAHVGGRAPDPDRPRRRRGRADDGHPGRDGRRPGQGRQGPARADRGEDVQLDQRPVSAPRRGRDERGPGTGLAQGRPRAGDGPAAGADVDAGPGPQAADRRRPGRVGADRGPVPVVPGRLQPGDLPPPGGRRGPPADAGGKGPVQRHLRPHARPGLPVDGPTGAPHGGPAEGQPGRRRPRPDGRAGPAGPVEPGPAKGLGRRPRPAARLRRRRGPVPATPGPPGRGRTDRGRVPGTPAGRRPQCRPRQGPGPGDDPVRAVPRPVPGRHGSPGRVRRVPHQPGEVRRWCPSCTPISTRTTTATCC